MAFKLHSTHFSYHFHLYANKYQIHDLKSSENKKLFVNKYLGICLDYLYVLALITL